MQRMTTTFLQKEFFFLLQCFYQQPPTHTLEKLNNNNPARMRTENRSPHFGLRMCLCLFESILYFCVSRNARSMKYTSDVIQIP